MADAYVRIGDPERSAATELLEGQLRAERITPEDFQRRVQRIATCRTVRDLDQAMVGFQHVTAQPALADLGQSNVTAGIASRSLANQAPPVAPVAPTHGPGWYEVLDPWDKPLGQSPLTLRKARRIGWVFAVAMSMFTAAPLSELVPSALEAFVVFSPILLMIVVSFWMAPNEKKAYRWVANPQAGNPAQPGNTVPPTSAPPTSTPNVSVNPMLGMVGVPSDLGSPENGLPTMPPVVPGASQPSPWMVDGPTFPTVGEGQATAFDTSEDADH